MVDLEQLSESDKRQLYNVLASQFGNPNAKTATWTDDELLVWTHICAHLGSQRDLGQTLVKAGKDYTRARYSDDVLFVTDWLDSGCGQKISRNQRQAIITDAVDCLCHWMKAGPAPVTHRSVLQQLTKTTAVIDQAYPGYHAARVLDWIAPLAA